LAIFTIHSRGPEPDAIRDALFLRDGVSFGAFWLGPFWLLRHGLYAACAAWIAAIVILAIAASTILSPGASLTVFLAIQALLGLEADHLLQQRLSRKGYRLVDIVAAKNLDEAEVGFFRRHDLESPPPDFGDRS
jgi:hypothetical protein